MLRTLKLLLPALVPSWRFFDTIAPSPRIEYALLRNAEEPPSSDDWREFRPRPARQSAIRMLGRLLWNPVWNESLFLVSCAERLIDTPTEHSQREIFTRIHNDLSRRGVDAAYTPFLRYRLAFVSRQRDSLVKEILYESQTQPLSRGRSS